MNVELRFDQKVRDRHLLLVVVGGVLLLMIMTVFQDLVESDLKRTGFYFSESFLFSSFWWLFVPALGVQYHLAQSKSFRIGWMMSTALISIVVHLLVYPLLVWVLSWSFNDHTFQIQQTFQYGLSAYLIKVMLAYTIPMFGFLLYKIRQEQKQNDLTLDDAKINQVLQAELLVTDGNIRTKILLDDVLYFSSNSPYVDIHHKTKKFIHNATLKAIQSRIGGEFVRIHKSTIVNLHHVKSYKSRLNGDYDIVMNDGSVLRLSRNFATDFKDRFIAGHLVAP